MNQNSKNKILLYAFLAAIVAVFFIPVPIWAKAAISLTLVLVFVYLRRSFMFFVMGAKKMEKKLLTSGLTQIVRPWILTMLCIC